MATRRDNSFLLYFLLGLVALASVLFHVRSVEQIFPQWFGITRAAWPFLLEARDEPHFLLDLLRENSRKAGLQGNDQLVAINGVPMRSRSDFADLLASSAPGLVWQVRYRREDQTSHRNASLSLASDRTASFSLEATDTRTYPVAVLFFVALPAFCLALGFWIVAVRVSDFRVWLLLAVLLSFATAFDSYASLWGPGWRVFGTVYRRIFDSGGLACLFLLGLYFPERFPRTSGWPWWKWLASIVLPIWAIYSACRSR